MKMNPLVSVVIPTYNRADAVAQAIDSVLNQTYKNTEIIVVDDGSTDNTKDALGKYGDKIKYFFKKNGGCSSARNFGIERSSGDYIAFLDSDDLWYPEKIEKQVNVLRARPDCALAICEVEFIDEKFVHVSFSNIKKHIAEKEPAPLKVLKMIREKQCITCSYMLLKKEVFGKEGVFNETLTTAEDADLLLRASADYSIALVEEPLIKYKKSADSLSNRVFTGNRLRVIKDYQRNNPDFARRNKKLFSDVLARIYLDYGTDLLWHRQLKEARRQILQSLRYEFNGKAAAMYLKSLVLEIVLPLSKNGNKNNNAE